VLFAFSSGDAFTADFSTEMMPNSSLLLLSIPYAKKTAGIKARQLRDANTVINNLLLKPLNQISRLIAIDKNRELIRISVLIEYML